jgi:hypothetical protein
MGGGLIKRSPNVRMEESMYSSRCRAAGGWIAGCLAATAVISSFAVNVRLSEMLPFSLLIFAVTCVLTAIPAALAIWLSRRFRIRSFVFFACSGAAIGVLAQGFLFQFISLVSWLFVAAGSAAGLIYWFVAGRHAGRKPG